MFVRRTLSWLVAAGIALAVAAAPASAQSDQTTLKLHDAAFATVGVEVRTGPTQEQSVPYGSRVLKKDETWAVSSNLPIYWRREVNPGSNDGKFTAWERVASAGDTTVDIG